MDDDLQLRAAAAAFRQMALPLVPVTRCPSCGDVGSTVEPVAQCGDYEHEHSDGCVVPEQVPCHCDRRPALVGAEVPF